MRRLNYLILIIFFITIVSCKNNGQYSSIKQCENRGVITEYVIDSCEIMLDSLTMDMYGKIQGFEDDNKTYIVGYNNKTHSFDWFDLIKNEVTHTKLDRQGPHSILIVHNFQVLDRERIMIGMQNKFSVINRKGEIIESFSTKREKEDYREFNSPLAESFCYDSITSEVVSLSFVPKQKRGLFAKVNLNTKIVKEFPIVHLDSHMDGIEKYGGWIWSYILNHKSGYVYSYNYSSDIFLYNENDDEHTKIEYRSKLSQNTRTPPVAIYPSKKAWSHHCRNPFFGSIKFDIDRRMFYRVHDKMVDKNASDEELKFRNADKVLTFFDENFENAYEFLLSKEKYFTGNVFSFKRGYAVLCNNPLAADYDPDVLKIHYYKFVLN